MKVISEAGSLSEISFAKEVVNFKKINNLEAQELSFLLGSVFVKIVNLIGISNPVTDINKQDIKEMILMRFKNISVEEISYAFKLERFGLLGERTQHFQLFNAEYVSTVLDKYKKWLQKTRQDNNLPISKPMTEQNTISKEEKEQIIIHGLITCFDAFAQTKKFDPNQIITHYHDYLMDKDLFNFTDEEKKYMWVQAKHNTFEKLKAMQDVTEYKKQKKEIEKGSGTWREIEYKNLRLEKYFLSILRDFKHIKDFI